jgi:hypothetical protein
VPSTAPKPTKVIASARCAARSRLAGIRRD